MTVFFPLLELKGTYVPSGEEQPQGKPQTVHSRLRVMDLFGRYCAPELVYLDIDCFRRCCRLFEYANFLEGKRLDPRSQTIETKYLEDDKIAGLFWNISSLLTRDAPYDDTGVIWEEPSRDPYLVLYDKQNGLLCTSEASPEEVQFKAEKALVEILMSTFNLTYYYKEADRSFDLIAFDQVFTKYNAKILRPGRTLNVFYSPYSYLNLELEEENLQWVSNSPLMQTFSQQVLGSKEK